MTASDWSGYAPGIYIPTTRLRQSVRAAQALPVRRACGGLKLLLPQVGPCLPHSDAAYAPVPSSALLKGNGPRGPGIQDTFQGQGQNIFNIKTFFCLSMLTLARWCRQLWVKQLTFPDAVTAKLNSHFIFSSSRVFWFMNALHETVELSEFY